MDDPQIVHRSVAAASVSVEVRFVGAGSGDMIAIWRRNLANRVGWKLPPRAAAASIAAQIASMRKASRHPALDEDEPHA